MVFWDTQLGTVVRVVLSDIPPSILDTLRSDFTPATLATQARPTTVAGLYTSNMVFVMK